MASKETLQIILSAKDEASNVFKQTQGSVGGLRGSILGLSPAAALGMAGVTSAAIGAGVALFNLGQDFEHATDIIKIGTGATGAALEGLKDDFDAVYKSVPVSTTEAATAIADLNTALGLTGKPLQDLSVQMLNLSDITGVDLSTNIQNVTRLFGDWNVATDDQADTLDYLFKTSQTTGAGVDTLATKVVQFGAPLRNLGFSLDETIALFGKWQQEGVNTETVMGGLKIAVGKFADAGLDARTEFERVVDAIKNAPTEMEATQIAIDTFGQRAGPDLADLIRGGKLSIDELMATIENSDTTINNTAENTDRFGRAWGRAKNQVNELLKPLGEGLYNAGTTAAQGLAIAAHALNNFDFGGFLFGTNNVKEVGGKNFDDLSKSQQNALNKMLLDQGVSGSQLSTNYGSTLGEISENTGVSMDEIASTLGIEMTHQEGIFETGWNNIKSFTSGAWNGIKEGLGAVWDQISINASAWWNGITSNLGIGLSIAQGMFNLIWNNIKRNVSETWDDMKLAAATKFVEMRESIKTQLNTAKTFIQNTWTNTKNNVEETLEDLRGKVSLKFLLMRTAVQTKVNEIKTWITDKFNDVLDFLRGIDLFQIGKDIIQGLIDGIVDQWDVLLGKINELAGKLPGPIKDVLGIGSPSKVFMQLGLDIGAGLVSGLDQSQGSINNAVQNMVPVPVGASGGGSRSTSVTIQNLYGTDRAAARQFAQMLAYELELQGVSL